MDIIIKDGTPQIPLFAFRGCKSLTGVTIPDSVKTIKESAFAHCYCLEKITIPNSVTSIEDFAFDDCINLTSVSMPKDIYYIGRGVFNRCGKLKSKRANYKAFDVCSNGYTEKVFHNGNFCRQNIEVKENEWLEEIKDIEIYEKGYLYYTNLFEVFNHYWGEIDRHIVIFEVETGDKIIQTSASRYLTNKIKPVKRLYREDVIKILNGGE